MGNSKSKNKKNLYIDDYYFDDFGYGGGYNQNNSNDIPNIEVDFDNLPSFTIPEFLKEQKKYIEEKTKEFNKKKTFDPIGIIDIMDSIISEKEEKNESKENYQAAVWAGGIGFGGGSTDNYNAKLLRDKLYTETIEREYVLIHIFDLFTKAISSTDLKIQRRTRRLFNRSQIRRIIGEYLSNDSMLDITKHSLFYWYTWKFLLSFASCPCLRAAIFRGSFYLHMQKLIEVAEIYKKRIEKMPSNVQNNVPGIRLVDEIISSRNNLDRYYISFKEEKVVPSSSKGAISTIDVMDNKSKHQPKRRRQTICDTSYDPSNLISSQEMKNELAEDIAILAKNEPIIPRKRKNTKKKDNDNTSNDNTNNDNNNKSLPIRKKKRKKRKKKLSEPQILSEGDIYVKELSELIFNSSNFSTHLFQHNKSSLTTNAISRIMLEIQSLADSLPTCLTPESGIYLRTNDEQLQLMKALIIGPPDTPYSLGCFEFDLFIPNNYPNVPPLCKIVTTGNQTFRFNPNLYANGKVCLSLIGTWAGAPEEQWDPKVSTLFQVFISIQSLILVDNPYYNEPGYQFSENNKANIDYTNNIRRGTTRLAILGQLKDKKSVFRDVIQTHCRLKKDKILQQCKDWEISDDILNDLTKELNNL